MRLRLVGSLHVALFVCWPACQLPAFCARELGRDRLPAKATEVNTSSPTTTHRSLCSLLLPSLVRLPLDLAAWTAPPLLSFTAPTSHLGLGCATSRWSPVDKRPPKDETPCGRKKPSSTDGGAYVEGKGREHGQKPTPASSGRLDLDGVLVAPITIWVIRADGFICSHLPREAHGRDSVLRPRCRRLMLQDPRPRRSTPAPRRRPHLLPLRQRQERLLPGDYGV
ncbi:uncharacterized protein LOC119300175 [Triticum dicoccoides]|uniref:uncharacterized protein LOC119300175 n=1 Tax=Triticum dicoccoides TaxID=85692 RepID=UPI00188DDD78|nr:uncharacterized protein LOC119300175 [Triticum dicoccoides]